MPNRYCRAYLLTIVVTLGSIVDATPLLAWGRTVWVHPNKQEGEFQRDYNECQQRAAQNAAAWGMRGNVFSIASDTNRCLIDLGWQKVKESDLRAAQQSPIYFIEWQAKFASVVRAIRGSTTQVVELTSAGAEAFADEFIEFRGTLASAANQAMIDVTNKSDVSARVLWDEASYVDRGIAKRLIHSGVLFAERNKPQMPSIIASRSTIKESIMPVDQVAELRGRWMRAPLFPKEQTFDQSGRAVLAPGTTLQSMNAAVASRVVGRDVRVLLPIEVGGAVREYTLVYVVTSTKVRSLPQAELEREFIFAGAAQ